KRQHQEPEQRVFGMRREAVWKVQGRSDQVAQDLESARYSSGEDDALCCAQWIKPPRTGVVVPRHRFEGRPEKMADAHIALVKVFEKTGMAARTRRKSDGSPKVGRTNGRDCCLDLPPGITPGRPTEFGQQTNECAQRPARGDMGDGPKRAAVEIRPRLVLLMRGPISYQRHLGTGADID